MRAARRVLAAALLGGAALAAVAGMASDGHSQMTRANRRPPTVGKVYPGGLPKGPGRELAQRACLMCHSASMTTQQRKDSTAWGRTLSQMMAWGAPLSAEERSALRDYLTTHFGPRP